MGAGRTVQSGESMSRSVTCNPLPFFVRRLIQKYKPHLREAISRAVQEKSREMEAQHKSLTPEDISQCVGEVVFGTEDRNLRMEQICLNAVERGDYVPIQDVIDELHASIARSPAS
jgi:hypothetical protein